MIGILVAYEWHNFKTGACYVDYIPHPGYDEKDGYTKTPLYKEDVKEIKISKHNHINPAVCDHPLYQQRTDRKTEMRRCMQCNCYLADADGVFDKPKPII